MQNKTVLSIIETILVLNAINVPAGRVEGFVLYQINQLPDFIKMAVRIFNYIFFFYSIIFLFCYPINASINSRIFFFKAIRDHKIPIFISFFRFYQSLIILRALEKEYEK